MIEKELLKRIILEKPRVKKLIKREIEVVTLDKIYTIIGPRRAGKTYFLFQIMNEMKRRGISEKQILYINFEDERLSEIEREDLQVIIDTYYELFPELVKKEIILMFDEIQNVPDWSKFVRRLYDKINCQIYITGSSSKLLSREIATELRGRTWTYTIFPFSFREFLTARGIKFDPNSIYTEDRFKIINEFHQFVRKGGFPEAHNLDEIKRCTILQDYFEVVIFRDVIERYNISRPDITKDLFKLLIKNFSRTLSINQIFHTLKSMGKSVSKDYIYKLISFIEETMYFFFIPIFSSSPRIQMVNPKKIYAIDHGLITCLTSAPLRDIGWLYENIVAIELIRRGYELSYYKGKYECDFIAHDKLNHIYYPIQVTLDPTKERELKGLLETMEDLKIKKGIIITSDQEKILEIEGHTIELIPLWKWLLKKL